MADKPSGATSYTQNAYTGSGDRVWQQVTNGSTTTTTLYLGTAEEIVTTGGTTTVTKYYYAGDRKVAQRVGSTLTYLVADGLSSVTQALSTTGTVVATHLFAPYGAVRYSQGTMPTAYGFTGTRLDASGLNALGERFYDPVVGQFVSADQTLPGSGAILGGLNRFAYVTGNPETATDPGGEWGFGSIFKAVTNVVKAAAPAVVHFVQAAAPVVASVADSALGISSMIGDVKTLFDPSKSWTDKLLSVADLAVNVAMDVDTITGTGEAARAAYMGLKVGVKMAGKAAEHAAIDEAEHLAVKEGEHAVEGEGEHLAEKAGNGAFQEGAKGGDDLGKIEGMELNVSQEGLDKVESHLSSRFDPDEANQMMIDRLRSAMSEGRKISGADASFYLHQLHESTLMDRGMEYAEAHAQSLAKYGVSPYSVYHPDVIKALPQYFNSGFRNFWRI